MPSTRAVALLLVLGCACNKDSPPISDTGPREAGPAKDSGRMTPSAICEAYLTCLAAAEPQSFPAMLQTYQADGPCWKSTTAASGCEAACQKGKAALALKYPGVAACVAVTPRTDAGPLPDWPYFPPPQPTKQVDLLFMIDTSNSMEPKQDRLARQFPRLIDALRSPKLGPIAAGVACSATATGGCKIPDLRIGVISANLGAGSFSFQTCETADGDHGKLLSTPGKLATPGCATPKDPWISYTDGTPAVTNVQNAKSTEPVEQVKEAFSCIAYRGAGGCGFEQQLESVRRALAGCGNGGTCTNNPGFLRPDSMLVVVLLTDEDDCSASNTALFDPTSPSLLTDPLGPYNSFRCTEFGLVCDEALRPAGAKHNCVPGLDYLYKVADYIGFFKTLRHPQRLLVAAIAGPALPVEVGLDGANPTLKASCNAVNGTGVPAVRIKTVLDGLGTAGLFNQAPGGAVANICSDDYSPALQLIGDRISQWY